jgi:S-layer protein
MNLALTQRQHLSSLAAAAATATQAAINMTTGLATFAAASGTTMADALGDISARFTAAVNSAGEFAFFRIGNAGNEYLYVSDGVAGVTANDVVMQLTGITSIGSINLTAGDLTILT